MSNAQTAANFTNLSRLFHQAATTGDLSALWLVSGVAGLNTNHRISDCEILQAEGAVLASLSCNVRQTERNLSTLSYEWDMENLSGRKVMDQLALWIWRALS